MIRSLYNDIWDVRIHFDAQENLERKLCSSDVTFLNIYALMETQGYSLSDSLYYMENPGIEEQGLELIDSNVKLHLIKRQNEESMCRIVSRSRGGLIRLLAQLKPSIFSILVLGGF